jgi:hypothetical protein
MKKLLMGLLAAGLVLAMALPAMAFDSEFGAYWRTRAYMQKDFTGSESGAKDTQLVDTRTRLFYTAVFSEDFKFVNAFEINNTWGDTVGGDFGTDATTTFRIKHTYANFTLGQVNFLVGLMPRVLHRGFVFSDDFAGLAVTFKGEGFEIPFVWLKAYEGGMGKDANDYDVDWYALKPNFKFGNVSLTPTLSYIYSKDAEKWAATSGNKELRIWLAGVDADVKIGASSLWFTGIYEGGDFEMLPSGKSADMAAYLVAAGGAFNAGPADLHGQIFYATGDDRTTEDYEAFFIPRSGSTAQSYYWAEIMGLGIFDNQASANSCADKISNILAANIGVGFKVSDKLKLVADLWYAKLAEDNAAGDNELGTEIDVVLTYSLMKNLNLDLVAAYLFAGDATYKGANDANPYEIGTRLSFSF